MVKRPKAPPLMVPLPKFTYTNPNGDEETLIIKMNGHQIARLTHDEHGWEGMQAVENVVRNIENGLEEAAKKAAAQATIASKGT